MKKLSIFLGLALMLNFASPAFAVDEKIENIKKEIKNERDELRKDIQVKKSEIKEIRTENKEIKKETNLENKKIKAEVVMKRLRQGMVNRYENINKHKANIEARIAKIETENVTSEKKRDLSAAKAKLATYNTTKYTSDLAAFDAKAAEIMASTTPLKLTSELKILAKNVDGDIKSLKSILLETLRLIIKSK